MCTRLIIARQVCPSLWTLPIRTPRYEITAFHRLSQRSSEQRSVRRDSIGDASSVETGCSSEALEKTIVDGTCRAHMSSSGNGRFCNARSMPKTWCACSLDLVTACQCHRDQRPINDRCCHGVSKYGGSRGEYLRTPPIASPGPPSARLRSSSFRS